MNKTDLFVLICWITISVSMFFESFIAGIELSIATGVIFTYIKRIEHTKCGCRRR